MNREEILRNLECAYEKLKDKPTFTGEINVGHMISDVISFIKEDTERTKIKCDSKGCNQNKDGVCEANIVYRCYKG